MKTNSTLTTICSDSLAAVSGGVIQWPMPHPDAHIDAERERRNKAFEKHQVAQSCKMDKAWNEMHPRGPRVPIASWCR